jgi:hypothetical protein
MHSERLDMAAEPLRGFIQLHETDRLHSVIFQLQGKTDSPERGFIGCGEICPPGKIPRAARSPLAGTRSDPRA